MVFAISQEQRADLVGRVADGLAGIGFHSYGLTLEAGSLKDKAEEIEARAFSVAEVASSTTKESWSAGTGGERPIADLTIITGQGHGSGSAGPRATPSVAADRNHRAACRCATRYM